MDLYTLLVHLRVKQTVTFTQRINITDVKQNYPGVTVENERILVCAACKDKVILNKLRSLTNYINRKKTLCHISISI